MNTRIIERKIEVMNYTLLYQKPETLEQLTTVQGNSGFSFNNFANFGGLLSWFVVRNACEQWVFSLPYKARSVHFNRDRVHLPLIVVFRYFATENLVSCRQNSFFSCYCCKEGA